MFTVRALQDLSARINRADSLEGLVDSILAGLEESFGFRNSMILVPTEQDGVLVTLATRGYPQSGAGAEVRHGEGPDYPLTAAAVALSLSAGLVTDAKVVLGQVAPTPWLSPEAVAALIGRPVSEASAAEAGAAAVASATPLSGNEYKVQLTQVAVKRAVS